MESTTTYQSPIGPLGIEVDDQDRLVRIDYWAPPSTPISPDHPVATALDSYFAGDPAALDDLDVHLSVGSFQQNVLETARKIPAGETRTYSWIASKIGHPGAARAVGNALGKNPVPIVIPCHRVVAASGLGGYTGGLEIKTSLLQIESRVPAS